MVCIHVSVFKLYISLQVPKGGSGKNKRKGEFNTVFLHMYPLACNDMSLNGAEG